MLSSLRRLFRPDTPASAMTAVPAGTRYYAVGDIHGQRALFDALLDAIAQDDAARAPADTRIVLLGDLVDRGPDSAGVIARARQLQAERPTTLLAGNHEEMFLSAFEDTGMLRHFLRHGGRETVMSYGVKRKEYDNATLDELQDIMHKVIPEEDRAFVAAFDTHHLAGDYLFVHAGIAPGVPLEQQKRHHLMWIREEFITYDAPHEHMIVHGHTISAEVDARANRIGIDTGAYNTGRLTALALEGTSRRTIQAVKGEDGAITIETESLCA
ncbi:serine/threonine protein phosphatase [Altererythrobacter sp. FM1]|uniref:Serine/threonine protein phosphatase n=2 Tax=Tsuneonella flava TaxID=2055955 RepID=A0ABX7K9I8_9SPHN|nr:serine/threonine protein phosphatase [Tsuneonella flava]ROT93857.1 serine/threonine protein phosphatase [Altererythrobacter sp. FM1]